MGAADKRWKEISCLAEAKQERGKEIGEVDKRGSKSNLCRCTLNEPVWERGPGKAKGGSTVICAKVTDSALRVAQPWG